MHGMIGLIRDRKDMLRRQQQQDKENKTNAMDTTASQSATKAILELPSHPCSWMMLPAVPTPQRIMEPSLPANNSKCRPVW
jgi:6-phosphogluconate dehydrogenase (decarboxylating)